MRKFVIELPPAVPELRLSSAGRNAVIIANQSLSGFC